jgi:hypothetical protein
MLKEIICIVTAELDWVEERYEGRIKDKDKVYPRTGHEGPEG